jgi:hypothetical protein
MSVPNFESWLQAGDPEVLKVVTTVRAQEHAAKARDKEEADKQIRLRERHTAIVDSELAKAEGTGNIERIDALARESETLVSEQRVQQRRRNGAQLVALGAEEARKVAERPVRRKHGAAVAEALVETMALWLATTDLYLASFEEFRRCGGGGQDYPQPSDALTRDILRTVARSRGVALQV